MECGHEFHVFRKCGVSMMAEWRQLGALTKIFYIGGLVGFIDMAIMILTVMTIVGDIFAWN